MYQVIVEGYGLMRSYEENIPLLDRWATVAYLKALGKGVTKVMSKMGISTLDSYKGAQIIEAICAIRRGNAYFPDCDDPAPAGGAAPNEKEDFAARIKSTTAQQLRITAMSPARRWSAAPARRSAEIASLGSTGARSITAPSPTVRSSGTSSVVGPPGTQWRGLSM